MNFNNIILYLSDDRDRIQRKDVRVVGVLGKREDGKDSHCDEQKSWERNNKPRHHGDVCLINVTREKYIKRRLDFPTQPVLSNLVTRTD